MGVGGRQGKSDVNHVGLLAFLLFHGDDSWWLGDANDAK